jgi:hypothetical protein
MRFYTSIKINDWFYHRKLVKKEIQREQ